MSEPELQYSKQLFYRLPTLERKPIPKLLEYTQDTAKKKMINGWINACMHGWMDAGMKNEVMNPWNLYAPSRWLFQGTGKYVTVHSVG